MAGRRHVSRLLLPARLVCGRPYSRRHLDLPAAQPHRDTPPSLSALCARALLCDFTPQSVRALSVVVVHRACLARGYTSVAASSRRRKRASDGDDDKKPAPPKRSALRPPKQAPSVWQLFFTDWLEQQKSHGREGRKTNVAQEAKEAGRVYNSLSPEQRDKLKQRALPLKERYERELAAWKRSLTPGDVAQENVFRLAQRTSGKSRLKNINDPNAPKRPPTVYIMFLQAVRADPQMASGVFGDVTDVTRQSVLAADKWRSMTDEQKQPYFAQAESAKLEYEALRKTYDEMRASQGYTITSVVVYPTSPSASPAARQEGDVDGDRSGSDLSN